ncbi:4-hydroxy-tetrahydrodipicolinate reductase [Kitasatospora sp. NPDC088783]|uniref:4-hydroxy-tetrahydrodipicolinate reductase n=1 Tax=Kitasatospora sp. NPDC088783 TaxID=3364077 RepID=UPI0037FFABFC
MTAPAAPTAAAAPAVPAPVPVVVCGLTGRMAGVVRQGVLAAPDLALSARLTLRAPDHRPDRGPDRDPDPGPDPAVPVVHRLADLPDPDPVVVDFTAEEATADLLDQARTVRCALVIGTSGLGDRHRRLLAEVGRRRPVVVAANYSLALLAVTRFVADLAAHADDSWDAGVSDLHFAGKRDRPSSTARHLAAAWHTARGPGAPAPDVTSFRLGDALSEHRLVAAGTGEHIEVLHRMADRRAFLPGVLRAIRYAAAAGPGVRTLADVVRDPAPAPR